jgi:hypothetical protein
MAQYDRIELLASGARGSSNTSGRLAKVQAGRFKRATIFLNVTAAATLVGDTLDVYVQKNVGSEDVPVWQDMVHFTQVLGNGGAKQFLAHLLSDTVTTALGAPQDGTLAAGVANGPWGDGWRVKWVVVGTGSFTFSVFAHLSGEG